MTLPGPGTSDSGVVGPTPAGSATAGSATAGSTVDAIVVRGLVKRYGARTVVDGLDLRVRRGELFALLGPNGAGKTTTVEILEGYRRRDGGTVRVLGLDPMREGAALRPRIGLMLQQGGIYPQARPLEMVRLFAAFYRQPLEPTALLERVGLSGVDRPYKVLSGGERQRLALALALVGRPELAVLDEPTAGMDPAAKAATREFLAGLRSEGVTILLTTHELADVDALADHVAIIARGRLVAEGSPAELTSATPRLRIRTARPLTEPERTDLAADLGLPVADLVAGSRPGAAARASGARAGDARGAGRLSLEVAEVTPALTARIATWCAANDLQIVELTVGGGSLEERYLELVGAAGDDPAEAGPDSEPAATLGGETAA